MTRSRQFWDLTGVLLGALAVTGCGSFAPQPLEQVPFMDRAVTQTDGPLRVTAAVLSAEESVNAFDLNLYEQGIQPIWLEIENQSTEGYWFLRSGLDPEYFSSYEVAYINHYAWSDAANAKMDRYFFEQSIGSYIPPGGTRSGFLFTNLDEGTKSFTVDLFGTHQHMSTFTFFIPVPGLRIDHHEVEFTTLYKENEFIQYTADQEEAFREALEALPCCTTNKKGTEMGDPLNLVILGDPKSKDVYHALMRAGWDETETIYSGSAAKTGTSAVFGGEYRHSPVSALYVFGRPQDAALQKARGSIHLRNHLRLWLAPMTFDGQLVWIGQISRDIGVRLTWKTITTHKIDPEVDEARAYFVENLGLSQGLAKTGWVKGVGPASMDAPRQNLTGDPYFTDGYRAIMWVSSRPVSLAEIQFVEWERPPKR